MIRAPTALSTAGLALGAVVIAVSTATVQVSAGSAWPDSRPAGTTDNAWGWATGRHATTVTYLLSSANGADSRTSQPYVTRQGRGAYLVTFPNSANGRGEAVIASALTTADRTCASVDPSINDAYLAAACVDRAGHRVDTQFSGVFLAVGDVGFGHVAYLFDTDPTASDFTPTGVNFNSTFAPNEVLHLGTGRWQVVLPGLGTTGGNVQVNADDMLAVCRAASWQSVPAAAPAGIPDQPTPGSETVNVSCRDFAGQLVDATFWLTFTDRVSLEGALGTTGAYLVANNPTAASYRPAAAYRYSSAAMAPKVTRSGPGKYLVTLPGMPTGGSAVVTPTGTGRSACALSSIRTDSTPQRIGVHCWRPDGTAIDTTFSLSYVH